MAFLNSNVSWNKMTFEANHVLTGVFNLHGWRMLISTQVFFHSCHPFPFFLVQVIIFYKIDWHSLMEIDVRPIDILESFVAYWQHFDIKWPQQLHVKGSTNPNTSQEATKVNAMVIVKKILPSFLTYAKIFAFNLCICNT